MEKYAI